MVARSPFLSERDSEISFLVRNEGLFRSLSSLSPGLSLSAFTQMAHYLGNRGLPTGKVHVRELSTTKPGRPQTVSHAALSLFRDLGLDISVRNWEVHLNVASDLRLIQRAAALYIV